MKDPEHLEYVRCLPCLICGGNAIAHHVRTSWNAGMGKKPPDRMTLPLSPACHQKLHNMGERRFWDTYGINEFEEIVKIIINRDQLPF